MFQSSSFSLAEWGNVYFARRQNSNIKQIFGTRLWLNRLLRAQRDFMSSPNSCGHYNDDLSIPSAYSHQEPTEYLFISINQCSKRIVQWWLRTRIEMTIHKRWHHSIEWEQPWWTLQQWRVNPLDYVLWNDKRPKSHGPCKGTSQSERMPPPSTRLEFTSWTDHKLILPNSPSLYCVRTHTTIRPKANYTPASHSTS